MLVGGISIAAFVPESYDHGVLFREREDVLPQDSSHIRDLHPFVIENPVLESVTMVGFAEILIDKTGIGAWSLPPNKRERSIAGHPIGRC